MSRPADPGKFASQGQFGTARQAHWGFGSRDVVAACFAASDSCLGCKVKKIDLSTSECVNIKK